jgi:hypothetical protein
MDVNTIRSRVSCTLAASLSPPPHPLPQPTTPIIPPQPSTQSPIQSPIQNYQSNPIPPSKGRYIHEATSAIPIIGDGDTGYGNAMNVKRTVKGYAAAGFAGEGGWRCIGLGS